MEEEVKKIEIELGQCDRKEQILKMLMELRQIGGAASRFRDHMYSEAVMRSNEHKQLCVKAKSIIASTRDAFMQRITYIMEKTSLI